MAEPTNVHTGDVRSAANALSTMGTGIEDAGTSLQTVGEDIKSNTAGETGVGAVIARFGSDGIVILSKALKELGRVSHGAGKRLGDYANDVDNVEHDLTDGIKGLTSDEKASLAGELKTKIALVPGGKGAEAALKNLSPEDRASLERLVSATQRARNRSADEFAASMSRDQLTAGADNVGRAYQYTGTNIENAIAGDGAIRNDPNITHLGTSQPGQPVGDFKVGNIVIDVTGRGATTLTGKEGKPYINPHGVVLSYPSIGHGMLKQIFSGSGTASW
jgi:hypothetical protein